MNTYTASTENGDPAFSTSGNNCFDFFTRITRNATYNDYIEAFTKAWKENKETAYGVLMNMRDIRNGKGEKLIPAVIMVYLKFNIEPSIYEIMLRKMVTYGYWKDLLRIIEIESRTRLEQNKKTILDICPIEVKLFAEQLKFDATILESTNLDSTIKTAISLCAKWAPSEKTHYDHHPVYIARNITTAMGIKPKQYRQLITKLRKHLNILEMFMSTQQYELIDFSKLPSAAILKMKHAFMRDENAKGIQSESRKKLHQSYTEYLRNLSLGKTNVNITGIQPHELISTYLKLGNHKVDELIEGPWRVLKERILSSGVFRDVTAIVDVSGSMIGQPMEVAIALGILIANCTSGLYHGKIITFHEKPSWHYLTGSTVKEQVECMRNAPWGGSTNLRSVFDLILNEAIAAKMKPGEMVKTLFIFTDMQFDQCDHGNWESTFDYGQRIFVEKGYQLPRIICWNLRTSSNKIIPVKQNTNGYAMLSGFSVELLKRILNSEDFTPYAMMMHVLEPYIIPIEISTCSISDLMPVSHLEIGVTKSAIKKAFNQPSIIPEPFILNN